MTQVSYPLQFRTASLLPQANQITLEDQIFRALVVLAMCLEIVVFVEPAPVDVMIVICLTLGILLRKLDFTIVGTVPLVALAVFALANLVSMYDPLDLERALWYVFVTLYLVASFFFFVGLFGHYGEPMMARLIQTYCVVGIVSAFLGAGGYFGFLPYRDTLLLAGRARGLFKDCNVYGPYFVPMALFALTSLMETTASWRQKVAPAVFFFSALVAMLLCFSRACWLNIGVSMAVFFVTHQVLMEPGSVQRRRLRMGGAIVLAGGLALVALMNVPAVQEMLALRVTSNGLQAYDRVRFATQDLAFDTAEKRPFGIGPGQSEVLFGYATHSMYMRILSENGSIALIAMLVFVAATALRALKGARQAESPWLRNVNIVVFACIIGHLANSVVIDTVHWRHIWFIYALPWAPFRAGGGSRTTPAGEAVRKWLGQAAPTRRALRAPVLRRV